uniref:CD276 antigen homolog n=1 Tax=Sinocyclocheilus grahami TaxID=75366 RepID=A0A672KE48_SINGR
DYRNCSNRKLFLFLQILLHLCVLSLQVPGVIGGSVVLPCSSTEPDQDTEVHWRQNGSKIVYDIIKGKDSVEQQEPRYKNRAETFPEEYKRGNFSIKLNDLQHTDAGKYTCLIAHSSEHKTVELIINETQTDVVTSSSLLWVYIIVAVLILIMLIAGFIIGYRKKIQAALFSPVMPEDKEQTEINV